MKILILGSEGQIGKPLFDHLKNLGHKVIGLDKLNSEYQDLSKNSNKEIIDESISWADKVIFLAFEVGGSKYLENADKTFDYIQENTMLMANVFESLRYFHKPFLFASSQMSNMHHTNYGFLKDLGERYTRSLGQNGWICRFWNVYGVERCSKEKRHVITDFINKANDNGRIEMISHGEEARQFLHVDDCNDAITQWVDGCWDNNNEYYDITSFEWSSILQIANIISQKVWIEGVGHPKVIPGEKEDVIQKGIRNTPNDYIRKFWTPKISLDEGIDKVMTSITKENLI